MLLERPVGSKAGAKKNFKWPWNMLWYQKARKHSKRCKDVTKNGRGERFKDLFLH